MKKALWGLALLLPGVLGVVIVLLVQQTTNTEPHITQEAVPDTVCEAAWDNEALLRQTLATFYRPCTQFYWVPIPDGEFHNLIQLNNYGLHGPNYRYEKPPNTYRIVIVGDSFPQGLQVPLEEGFPYLVQQQLNTSPLSPTFEQVEVINLAVDAYGTDRQLLLYALVGWRFEPDLVLLSFYVGNDIKDNFIPFNELNEGLKLERPAFSLSEVGTLQLHDAPQIDAADFPDSVVWGWLAAMAANSTPRPEWPTPTAPEILSTAPYELAYPVDLGLYLPPDEQWRFAWDLTGKLVTTFQEVVQAQGLPFGVILIPDRRVVHPADWDRTLEQYPFVQGASPLAPQQRMNTFLTAAEIPYLDLTPTLRNWTYANPNQRLYYLQDGHFNAAGHASAAQRISLWLQGQGWLLP